MEKIPIITVHQAKGTEFDYVFVAGLHDGLFPMRRAVASENLEEEERLFYVAMTRAKKKLFLSYSDGSRTGRLNMQSRFIDHVPAKYVSVLE